MKAQKRSFVRKAGAAIAAGACLVGLGSTPVAADQPFVFEDTVVFDDINPCSGEPMEVSITNVVRIHEHRNNFVVHVSKTGTTDDGHVMRNGVESFVANKNIERGTFTDNWTGPDGSKFKAQGGFVFDINNDEYRVERFTLRCVGN